MPGSCLSSDMELEMRVGTVGRVQVMVGLQTDISVPKMRFRILGCVPARRLGHARRRNLPPDLEPPALWVQGKLTVASFCWRVCKQHRPSGSVLVVCSLSMDLGWQLERCADSAFVQSKVLVQ